MIVTDLNYFLEKPIIKKLDLMLERCTTNHPKRDAVLIVEGGEGEGKTNTSIANAYYLKYKSKRDIHLFFKLKSLVEFAQATENKIIIWDEPALDSLSTDWYKKTNQDLIRLLMVARKKRHFFMFNFTKFYKFSEYIIVDRGLGLIHMYSRREIEPGRFVYIRKKNLERLYLGWRISKKRLYRKYATSRGSYPDILEKYFDKMGITVEDIPNATYQDYEREKDKAIASVGRDKVESKADIKLQNEYIDLKIRVGRLKPPIKNNKELCEQLNLNRKTLYTWGNLKKEAEIGGFPKENGVEKPQI